MQRYLCTKILGLFLLAFCLPCAAFAKNDVGANPPNMPVPGEPLCKEGDTYTDDGGNLVTCRLVDGNLVWQANVANIPAPPKHLSDDEIANLAGKHLALKTENYEGTAPAILEKDLPENHQIITTRDTFNADVVSDKFIIMVDDNGDILTAGYGEVLQRTQMSPLTEDLPLLDPNLKPPPEGIRRSLKKR